MTAAAATLTLPRLGETMESGRVVGWLKRPGEAFRRGETIVEVETDKTVVELPALSDGRLLEILAPEGEDVAVGMPLCRYEGGGAAVAAETAATTASAEAPGPAPVAAAEDSHAGRAGAADGAAGRRATPRARSLAREHGIDLVGVAGTGRRGRVQGTDVLAAAGGGGRGAEATGTDARGLLFADLPEGRLAYRAWPAASGAPARGAALLLHGLGGDAQTWAGLAPFLARQGYEVLAPDLPGHGATAIEAGDVAGLAAPLGSFLAACGLGEVELVGHSLGAAAAVRVAAGGARVGRLTLLAPVGLGAEIDAAFVAGIAAPNAAGGLAHLLRRASLRSPELSPERLAAMAAGLARGRLARLAAAVAAGGRQQLDLVAGLEGLREDLHVRIVWGLEDRIVPWTQVALAPTRVAVHLVPAAGHMPHWDQPRLVAGLFG